AAPILPAPAVANPHLTPEMARAPTPLGSWRPTARPADVPPAPLAPPPQRGRPHLSLNARAPTRLSPASHNSPPPPRRGPQPDPSLRWRPRRGAFRRLPPKPSGLQDGPHQRGVHHHRDHPPRRPAPRARQDVDREHPAEKRGPAHLLPLSPAVGCSCLLGP